MIVMVENDTPSFFPYEIQVLDWLAKPNNIKLIVHYPDCTKTHSSSVGNHKFNVVQAVANIKNRGLNNIL